MEKQITSNLIIDKKEIKKLKMKYPDKIPILVYPIDDKQPKINKNKYLVPKTITIAEFLFNLKKRIKINERDAIFLFVENKNGENNIPASNAIISDLFYINQKENVLIIKYGVENTFG